MRSSMSCVRREKSRLALKNNKTLQSPHNFGYSPLSKRPKLVHDRYRRCDTPEFADYSVSPTEQYQLGVTPMRKVSSCERKILTNSSSKEPRLSYLKSRYEHLPKEKYYFPAANSWRYDWHVQKSVI